MALSNENLMVIEKMNDKENYKYLHPMLMNYLFQLIWSLEKDDIRIRFSEGFRTKERQMELYAQGRSNPGGIITNCDGVRHTSQHQWGIAIDFYLDMDIDGDGQKKDDAFNNATQIFNKVGARATSIGLGWGGNWKMKDMPHLYLPYWGATGSLLVEKFGTYENFRESWKKEFAVDDAEGIPGGLNDSIWDESEWVKSVQTAIGARIDGIAGKETISKTPDIGKKINNRHAVVAQVQKKLNAMGHDCGAVDGIFGENTERGVVSFQEKFLRMPDGIMNAGNVSWRKLLKEKL